MLRHSIWAAAVVILAGSAATAETYLEKIQAIDADKKTSTIAVEGKDRALKVDDKVDVKSQVRVGKRLRVTPLKGGLKAIKAGTEATVDTEKLDGAEVVTKIVVLSSAKR